MLHNCIAEIKRFVYVDWKATIRTTIWNYEAYITALSEESSLMSDIGKFWKLYKLSLTQQADIQESDLIVVNGKEYTAKGVSFRQWGNLSLTTVILELWT